MLWRRENPCLARLSGRENLGNSIIEHWNSKERKLPGINCIAFPDGKVIILNCHCIYDPNTKKRELFCAPLCDTTIDSIEKYAAAYWTHVDAWVSIDYQGGKIHGGDGAMGNEGFMARTDEYDQLIWGMFFENTNPIKSLEIKAGTLVAINEHSELRVEVNLDTLTDIKMILE
jgi:hypothetical protein